MMKNKTYLKTTFREIKHSKGRFIAIILIILLGTLLYVGVKTAGPVMQSSASHYVNKQKLSDLQIISTAGITADDESLTQDIPDADIEAGYQLYSANAGENEVVQLFSYKKAAKQNQLILKEGELPQNNQEIVLDEWAKQYDYHLGDIYTINEPDHLEDNQYKIVGFVDSPLFVTTSDRGYANIGSGTVDYFAYLPEASFISDVKTVLYVSFADTKKWETYSDEYKTEMKKKRDLANTIFENRPAERLSEIKADAESELAPARQEIADGLIQVTDGEEQLAAAQNQLNQQKQSLALLPKLQQNILLVQLVEAQAQLDEQKAELAESQQELTDAQAEITEHEKELAQLKEPTYLFNERAENIGFQEYGDLSERIAAIANVFPVFFFFIAALITFTTMTRMVEENRREIGTLKALGYSKFEIAKKYLIYALSALIIGVALGSIIGTNTLPRIVFELSGDLYNIQDVQIFYLWKPIIQAALAFFSASVGSALFVLLNDLREKPAGLLQSKAPKPGKRILLEYITPLWRRLSFNQKISYRNLFRYKSRMVMAIVGIAGCAGLMVAGVGLNDSLGAVTAKQFGPIIDYQAIVTLSEEDLSKATVSEVENHIEKNDAVLGSLSVLNKTVEMRKSGHASQSITMTVPQDVKLFHQYIHLLDENDQTFSLGNNGVVLSQKTADLFSINVGDKVTFYDEDQVPYEMEIQAITKNYLGNFVYLSKDYYEKTSNEELQENASLIKTEKMSAEAERKFSEQLLTTDKVSNITFVSKQIEMQENSISNLDAVVIIFVVLSGLLAFIVLYNLTNINISERVRELSTIKVLGFYDQEVTMYIIRENIIFTLLGIVAGYGVGYVLTGFILQQASMENVIFPLVIHWPAYVLSGAMTIIFTIIVMIVTHFKLKNINMIDAQKSNE